MALWLILKLLHVLAAIALIGGLLGRGLAFGQARQAARQAAGQADHLQAVHALLSLSERFERLLVRPGSELVIVLGLLTAWFEGQPILGALQGAQVNWVLVSLVLYLLTIPLVFVVLLPRTRRRTAAAAAAVAAGRVTPELRAALDDRAVALARDTELLLVFLIVVLMVLKPF